MFSLSPNWVDLIILVIFLFFIHQGLVSGFWAILIDFLAFLGSLLISLKAYKLAATFLEAHFSVNRPLSNALGYLIIAIIIEILISFSLTFLVSKLPARILKNKITKIFGVILSLGQGIILIAFAITFLITLPINPSLKTDISNSKIGGFILQKTSGLEKVINNIFGNTINTSLTYTTIEPKSKESISLNAKSLNLSVDQTSEDKMVNLVNLERKNRGLGDLKIATQLQTVARNYATKMWQENYFGHYDKKNKDVSDRLQAANIYYTIAGENLALAPTVDIAHHGLMNSEGHKANILEVRFKKIGIGVIDNLYYGKMFVQVFTD